MRRLTLCSYLNLITLLDYFFKVIAQFSFRNRPLFSTLIITINSVDIDIGRVDVG